MKCYKVKTNLTYDSHTLPQIIYETCYIYTDSFKSINKELILSVIRKESTWMDKPYIENIDLMITSVKELSELEEYVERVLQNNIMEHNSIKVQ